MHKPPLPDLVYNAIFPKPRHSDPSDFGAHITKNLVPEVRIEISTFYGALDCVEAQYPGLDYSYPPHRMRLGRFPNHRRLFKVFDELRLTPNEIASLCCWEGTKFARDGYERGGGVRVRDTTLDGIRVGTPPPPPTVHVHVWEDRDTQAAASNPALTSESRAATRSGTVQTDDTIDEESSDEDLESFGFALNQHLLEAAAARERGANVSLDDVWEQWLKDAIERGSYEDILNSIRDGTVDFTRDSPGHALNRTRSISSRQRPVYMVNGLTSALSSITIPDPAAGSSSNSANRTAS